MDAPDQTLGQRRTAGRTFALAVAFMAPIAIAGWTLGRDSTSPVSDVSTCDEALSDSMPTPVVSSYPIVRDRNRALDGVDRAIPLGLKIRRTRGSIRASLLIGSTGHV